MGNIVNRVFDSSGPEGKVRGTPQQIIDKYLILARDAQLSNDRVAAENFLQHAEHYTRMLGEAQRELQREAESRRESQDANQNNYRDNRDRPRREAEEPEVAPAFYTPEPPRPEPRAETRPDPRHAAPTDVIDFAADEESDTSVLVDTPESRPEPAPAPVIERAVEPDAVQPERTDVATDAPVPEKRPRANRRRPAARKPRAEGAAAEPAPEASVGE